MRSILFHIGNIPIRSYGLMITIGFLLGVWRATKVSQKRGISSDQVVDSSLVALISGIIGARLLFLLLSVPKEGWGIFSQALRIWEGGLSFHGGLIAAIGAVAVYTKIKKIDFLDLADVLAPSVAIGYAFARIGCFLNGCCYGCETHAPWAVRFFDSATQSWTPPSHPAQMYAFAINLGIFWILTRVERLSRPKGFLFCSYITLYSIYRFGIEFIRKGVTASVMFAGLTQAQVASLAAILVFGIILLKLNRSKSIKNPGKTWNAGKGKM